jgi:hypothetical protein
VDAALGHYRRYTAEQMRQAGFEVVRTDQFNKLGTLGWCFSGKIMRRKALSPGQMRWFERLRWLAKMFEFVPGIPVMSLIMVRRKRAAHAPEISHP